MKLGEVFTACKLFKLLSSLYLNKHNHSSVIKFTIFRKLHLHWESDLRPWDGRCKMETKRLDWRSRLEERGFSAHTPHRGNRPRARCSFQSKGHQRDASSGLAHDDQWRAGRPIRPVCVCKHVCAHEQQRDHRLVGWRSLSGGSRKELWDNVSVAAGLQRGLIQHSDHTLVNTRVYMWPRVLKVKHTYEPFTPLSIKRRKNCGYLKEL